MMYLRIFQAIYPVDPVQTAYTLHKHNCATSTKARQLEKKTVYRLLGKTADRTGNPPKF
jgi:hypothetical protein